MTVYQLFRGLAFLHNQHFCHRDIKPHNILIDSVSGVLKICDLGSMKKLRSDVPNVSYICSRYFRAPELLMGAEYYSCAIGGEIRWVCFIITLIKQPSDIWSVACTAAELYLHRPLFAGSNSPDQLARIFKYLGEPAGVIDCT